MPPVGGIERGGGGRRGGAGNGSRPKERGVGERKLGRRGKVAAQKKKKSFPFPEKIKP